MATTFTDKKGRTWDVSLDLLIARRIDKSDFSNYHKKFSILAPERDLLGKLLSDAPFLFAIIWVIVQDQAEAKYQEYKRSKAADCTPDADSFPISPREPTPEGSETSPAELEFVSGINGPTIEAARNAIIEALGDFFPDQRTVLSALANQMKAMSKTVGDKLEKALPTLNTVLEEEMDSKIQDLQQEFRNKIRESSSGETSSQLRLMPG